MMAKDRKGCDKKRFKCAHAIVHELRTLTKSSPKVSPNSSFKQAELIASALRLLNDDLRTCRNTWVFAARLAFVPGFG